MTDNIINKEHVEAHTVQRYRFKVLGSSVSDLQASSTMEEELPKDPFESTDEVVLINEIPKVLRTEESSQHLFETFRLIDLDLWPFYINILMRYSIAKLKKAKVYTHILE